MLLEVSKSDSDLILKIAQRANNVARLHHIDYQVLDAVLDLTACHANGTALDLQKLLDSKDIDFYHDVFGIKTNISRTTGQLKNGFSPRIKQRT